MLERLSSYFYSEVTLFLIFLIFCPPFFLSRPTTSLSQLVSLCLWSYTWLLSSSLSIITAIHLPLRSLSFVRVCDSGCIASITPYTHAHKNTHAHPLFSSFSSLPGYHSPNCSAATVPSPIITACQKELIFSFLIKTCKKLPCYYNTTTLWRHQRKPNLILEILPLHIKLNT